MSDQTVCSPSWLYWLYHAYKHSVPPHQGKRRFLRWMEGRISRHATLFPWRLDDGNVVAIRPDEAVLTFGVAATCFHARRWEPHVGICVQNIIRPGDTCLDVGANIGVFTIQMARAAGDEGRVLCFEPSRRTYEQLLAAIAVNRLHNVVARCCAVGEVAGNLELRVPRHVSGNASLFDRAGCTDVNVETVEVIRLDDTVNGRVRLMKVDVEGAEMAVLRGAREVICRDHPYIIVEWNQETASAAGWNYTELYNYLQECGGYNVSIILTDGKLLRLPAGAPELEEGGYVDLLCEPK